VKGPPGPGEALRQRDYLEYFPVTQERRPPRHSTPSDRRERKDPLPVELVATSPPSSGRRGDGTSVPRYQAQRRQRQRLKEQLLGDALHALSALRDARAGRPLLSAAPAEHMQPVTNSALQESVVARLRRGIRECFPPPTELRKEEALRELLHTDDIYGVSCDAPRVAFDLAKLRVSKGDLRPKEVFTVVDAETRAYIDDPDGYIVKTEAEQVADADREHSIPAKPYWDPTLINDRKNMHDFLKALWGANLLSFRKTAKSFIGAFFAKKKDGMQRLVLDCRIPNACHRRPPHSSLAIPGSLARLIMSDESVALAEAELCARRRGERLDDRCFRRDLLRYDGRRTGFGRC